MQETLVAYKRLPIWTSESLPAGFRKQHNTKEGTWAKLTVMRGMLKFHALNQAGQVQSTVDITADRPMAFIEPQAWHKVEPYSEDLECYLEFYCAPARYYEKKYGLTAPHSAVVEAITHVSSGDALDLGCGRGRNSILLRAHGFEVTALDHSQQAISRLQEIVSLEAACQGIQAEVYDIATSSIERDYDLIICTVVLQFLPADTIAGIISNMQSHTKLGGLNVIVAPMSTHDVPCPMDWPFTFKEGELRAYYQDWHLIKYQEALGEFHRTDAAGNRLQACFATLIARKQ